MKSNQNNMNYTNENENKSDDVMGLDDEEIRSYKFASEDNVIFELTKQEASLASLLSDMIDMAVLDGEEDKTIEVKGGVKGDALAVIVEFLKQHNGVALVHPVMPLRYHNLEKLYPENPWDASFAERVWEEAGGLPNRQGVPGRHRIYFGRRIGL